MNKALKIIIALLLLATIIAGIMYAVSYRRQQEYLASHIFVEDAVYPQDAETLDLRGTGISVAHYETLRKQLPDCTISWELPFQGLFYPNDTTELTVTSLTDEDVALLDYLPGLTAVHAEGCTDYPQLMALQARRPECRVNWQVTLSGESYPHTTRSLTFTDADPAQLLENIPYLPDLESIHFIQPEMAAEDLLLLRETFPNIAITWEKDVLGATYADDVTELDFSGMALESLEELEALMKYFPDLEKLILCDCGFDNETLAAFRERVRQDYKVVWSVKIYTLVVRTDELTFMPEKYDLNVTDAHLKDLVYCEDMLCVDLGHKSVRNLDFLYGMPHLQYLIVADSDVTDITAVGSLKELIYLEVFKTDVSDYSPLLGCTSLEDVNLAFTDGDASVFAEMPWLKNLWINCCGVDQETRQLLIEALPNTTIEFDHGWHMGNSWRGVENYFRMRDLLEMPYYDWGNQVGRPEWAKDWPDPNS